MRPSEKKNFKQFATVARGGLLQTLFNSQHLIFYISLIYPNREKKIDI